MRMLTIALCLAIATSPAAAQNQCLPRVVALDQLANKYHETRRGMGMEKRGGVVEVWAAESGSWTISVTFPDGRFCLIASGQGFETLNETLAPQGKEG